MVIKDAQRIEGPLVLWRKDERLWLELTPEQIGKPFLLSPKVRTGIGEGLVLGGLMAMPINGAGGSQVIEFVRVNNSIRLQARNTDIDARANTPEARAVAAAFSASLLGATAVASQPHPERKSILIDAGTLFLSDMLGLGMQLQSTFRQGYGLDRANTVITAVRGTAEATVIETLNHFYSGGVSSQSFGVPGSIAPQPRVPRFLPDTRSLLIGLHFSLMPLPDKPMATRRADARIGHFWNTRLDFSDDQSHTPRQRSIHRWRLEKKDPAAEMSEPAKPITFWIDRNVPLQYRDTVRAGILEWNKAFERIGFKDAIVVQQQSDEATFDTLDAGIASVRWMTNADSFFTAIGPSHVDPRSGEILDADVAIESMASRAIRATRNQVLAPRALQAAMEGQISSDGAAAAAPPSFAQPFRMDLAAVGGSGAHAQCQHGLFVAEQMSYALDVLQARGDVEASETTTQEFVLAYIKDTVMHEVGHALGLRHNFRASRVYTEAQLADSEFTRTNGTSGSVMEYTPVNLAAPGQAGGKPFQGTLGPYDYWAIEYAYRPMPPGTTPEQEEVELLRIAARSSEPMLAFGTDEDSFMGLDSESIQWDLGADPVAFATKRLAIARDLFQRQETRILPGDRDYAVLRRSLSYALGDVYRAVEVLARQIGGLRTLRDFPGSGRDPLQPVPAAVQRQAVDLLARSVLATDGLRLTAALQRRLAPDYFDRIESGGIPTDYALPQRLMTLQRQVLGYLMSDYIAARVLDGVGKVDRPQDAYSLAELYSRLSSDVWAELTATGAAFTPDRRELQREHAARLALTMLRPSASMRADARSLLRMESQRLLARLDTRLKGGGLDVATRAHLVDSADQLRQALAARVVRGAP